METPESCVSLFSGLAVTESRDHTDYCKKKNLRQLFKSLWLGIVYHQPEDPVGYLLAHVEHLRHNPSDAATITDFSFLPVSDNKKSSRGTAALLPSSRASTPQLPVKQPTRDGVMDPPRSMGPPSSVGVKRKREENGEEVQREKVLIQRLNSNRTTVTTSTGVSSPSAGQPGMSEAPTDMNHSSEEEEDDIELDLDLDLPQPLHDRFWRILEGAMSDLPRMPTNTVRIFLSSTFSDFKAERNKLPLLAYPQLETWCATKDLDFQVVDMRWGVTDDVVQDHQVSPLCIEEIRTCQQLSCGPNFVVLLGDRYGWQGFPPRIQCEEFRRLLSEIQLVGDEPTKLLQTWFLEDKNAVPPEYVLQPIHVHLKHYHDSEQTEARDADRKSWAQISASLQKTLRMGAKAARDRGDFTEEQERKYFMSVTEEEIQQGVFCPADPEYRTMCYHRSLLGIAETKEDVRKGKFIDVDENNQIDREAAALRQGLVEEKLPSQLPEENIREYDVKWMNIPLERSTEAEHLAYLSRFCADFVVDVKRLVESQIMREEGSRETRDKWNILYHEVLHHARFGNMKSEVFCGRTDEIKIIRDYLNSKKDSTKPPFIIHGVSGMGKTALMAHVASRIHDWFPKGSVVILRFLGTSPHSSSIADTLSSIIDQLCAVYKITLPKSASLDMFGSVRREFHRLLDLVARKLTCPLVIVLDSVDQLSPQSGAHRMLWLPKLLPKNIYFIVSMLSTDKFNCLENTKQRFKMAAHYLGLPPLSEFTGDQIMDSHLARIQRRLTEDQRKIVVSAFKCLRHPLYLKLVIDEAKQWVSYLPTSAINILPPNTDSDRAVRVAIMKLFESMESKHGSVFVRHALGYLTCGKGGLTNIEMEDILSCDDDVLNEVYQYHEPPLEGVVRIPSLLWSRLQFALKEYICERRVDGKVVLTWYHRQFWEAAERMYLNPVETKKCRHRALAEMFDQESGIKCTITLYQLKGKVIEDADRRVKAQPLIVTNLRKLQAVPFHLFWAGDYERLISRCLVNFKWLLLKLQAFNINAVIRDYEVMNVDPSVALFKKFLELCFDALKQDPHLLAYNIVARLGPCTKGNELLEKAVADAKHWLGTTDIPLLVPTHDLELQAVDSPLTFSMLLGYYGQITKDERMIVCEWSETNSGLCKIQTLDIKSRDIVASVRIQKPTPYRICPDGRHFVFVEEAEVRLHEIDCGDVVLKFPYTDIEYDKVTVRCLAISDNGKLLAACVRNGKPKNQATSKQWKSECLLYLIDLEQQKIINSIPFKRKKLLDTLFFIQNDQFIFASCKSNITVYDAKDLKVKQELGTGGHHLDSSVMRMVPEKNLIIGTASSDKKVKVFMFDCLQMTLKHSDDIHVVGEDHKTVAAFALHLTSDLTHVLVGSWGDRGTDNQPATSICLWRCQGDQTEAYTKMVLEPHGFKPAHSLLATPDWRYALIGWQNGLLGVTDLSTQHELKYISAHGHSVYYLNILSDGNTLLSMSQDHTFKVWDLQHLLQQAKSVEEPVVLTDLPLEELWLHRLEQCLTLIATERFLVSAPSNNLSAPRFWSYEDGKIVKDMSKKCQDLYDESLAATGIDFPSRMHGSVHEHSTDVLIYERKRRSGLTTFVTKGYSEETNVVVHRRLDDLFFRLLSKSKNTPGDMNMYAVHNGTLSVYNAMTLEVLKEIEIPKLTDDIPDVSSKGGKKRLLYYNVGLTVDERYFLIVNPGGGVSGKYMDIIQLQKNKYKKRVHLAKHIPFQFLSNGVYFMCKNKTEELQCLPAFLCKERMVENGRDFDYRCLVRTERFLSHDESIGVSIHNKTHAIHVWRLDPLEQMSVLLGQSHEVTSAEISRDNKYLVSGSYDNTIRLWELGTGQQLALFNAYGAVDGTVISPDMRYIGVQCYSAPQRKRGLVLEIKNMKKDEVMEESVENNSVS